MWSRSDQPGIHAHPTQYSISKKNPDQRICALFKLRMMNKLVHGSGPLQAYERHMTMRHWKAYRTLTTSYTSPVVSVSKALGRLIASTGPNRWGSNATAAKLRDVTVVSVAQQPWCLLPHAKMLISQNSKSRVSVSDIYHIDPCLVITPSRRFATLRKCLVR